MRWHRYRELVDKLVPTASKYALKGEAGRLAVIGGCSEYCGAPFLAAMTALRLGCDLSTVMCAPEAAIPIKSYSPDLMVQGSLIPTDEGNSSTLLKPLLDWLPRLHTLVIGPGLGRDERMFNSVIYIISVLRKRSMPVVLDGDALFLVSQKPELISGYSNAVLTPNAREFRRLWLASGLKREPPPLTLDVESILCNGDEPYADVPVDHCQHTVDTADLAKTLGGVTIVRKGAIDIISNGETAMVCEEPGCWRRVGGQGDVLAGAVGAFVTWAELRRAREESPLISNATASLLASISVRKAAHKANARSMLASDLVRLCPDALEDYLNEN